MRIQPRGLAKGARRTSSVLSSNSEDGLDVDCDLTISLRRITAHVIAYRFQLESERHDQMNRMLEKLTMASEVAPRQAAKIEARADKIIARESKIEHATDLAFTPHEMLLDQAEAGLDAVEHALATMSNNPPLDDSGTS